MNRYTNVVDFLEDFINNTEDVWKQPDLPHIEAKLMYALKVLKEQEDYQNAKPKLN